MASNDTYAAITGKIVGLIESDQVAPWQRSWNLRDQAPVSMSSRKRYRGINTWILLSSPYSSRWWGTFKQIAALGGQVRKGEKSTVVVFWKQIEVDDPTAKSGKKRIPYLRTFNVFNAEQADGLPEKFTEPPKAAPQTPQYPEAHAAYTAYVSRSGIKEAVGNPAYSPFLDTIYMPGAGEFDGEAEYLGTAFHEAGHSTGAKGRLDRDLANVFGSHGYSREELVAEFTAAMLSAHFGFTNDRLAENQAAYLKSWVKALQDDPQMLVWAAGRAEKAADHILGTAQDETPEEVAE